MEIKGSRKLTKGDARLPHEGAEGAGHDPNIPAPKSYRQLGADRLAHSQEMED